MGRPNDLFDDPDLLDDSFEDEDYEPSDEEEGDELDEEAYSDGCSDDLED